MTARHRYQTPLYYHIFTWSLYTFVCSNNVCHPPHLDKLGWDARRSIASQSPRKQIHNLLWILVKCFHSIHTIMEKLQKISVSGGVPCPPGTEIFFHHYRSLFFFFFLLHFLSKQTAEHSSSFRHSKSFLTYWVVSNRGCGVEDAVASINGQAQALEIQKVRLAQS